MQIVVCIFIVFLENNLEQSGYFIKVDGEFSVYFLNIGVVFGKIKKNIEKYYIEIKKKNIDLDIFFLLFKRY